MSKINTQEVKNKVISMMGDLRSIVVLYMNNKEEVSAVESNMILTREYKDSQIKKVHERTMAAARNKFDMLQQHFEELAEVLRNNDNTYDFSDPEFASCIALMNASTNPLPLETVLGIVNKFLGNRQALIALAEVAKGTNEATIRKHIFNSESEMEALRERLISLDINFPGSIVNLPSVKNAILNVTNACGEELTDQEQDLGADYHDIVNMQIRAAMGL